MNSFMYPTVSISDSHILLFPSDLSTRSLHFCVSPIRLKTIFCLVLVSLWENIWNTAKNQWRPGCTLTASACCFIQATPSDSDYTRRLILKSCEMIFAILMNLCMSSTTPFVNHTCSASACGLTLRSKKGRNYELG